MNFPELIRARRSVRTYEDRAVPRDALERCVEAARLAPSACNAQPWTFVVVDEPGLCGEVGRATRGPAGTLNTFVERAPVIVVVVAEPSNLSASLGSFMKNRQLNLLDVGIAVEHFCLQAVTEGLGTCILGWFDEKKIKSLLGIPMAKRIGLLVTVGYPGDAGSREKKRKRLDEILGWNRYGKQP